MGWVGDGWALTSNKPSCTRAAMVRKIILVVGVCCCLCAAVAVAAAADERGLCCGLCVWVHGWV